MSNYSELKTETAKAESSSNTKPGEHRVLVLGGGGTTALKIQMKVLMDLYGPDIRGHDLLKKIGCKEVIGTSAGSLAAAAFAGNYKLGEINAMSENEAFLKSVYAKKTKTSPINPDANTGFFVPNPNQAKMGLGEKVGELQRDFGTAAMEITTGGKYSAEAKTAFLGQVVSHTVDPDHPAVKDIPSLSDGSMKGLGDKNFEELYKMTGVHFSCICQDRATKETVLVTTRTDVPDEANLRGEKVNYVRGNEASIKNAISGSANPRPLFNGPVRIGKKYRVDDGGMTGNNLGIELALKEAERRGIPLQNVTALCLGVGEMPKNYLSPNAIQNPMVYASQPYDSLLDIKQKEKLANACMLHPNPEANIVFLAPTSPNTNNPFNYVSSMIDNKDDLKKLSVFWDEYASGTVPSQMIEKDGKKIGYATYSEGLNSARKFLGIEANQNGPQLRNQSDRVNTLEVSKRAPSAGPLLRIANANVTIHPNNESSNPQISQGYLSSIINRFRPPGA